MAQGKIKFYNHDRGFGFIEQDEGEDIFFHVSGFVGDDSDIEQNARVNFQEKEGKKGALAVNVTLVK